MKKCPYCEEILEEAKKCMHCNEWFDIPKNETEEEPKRIPLFFKCVRDSFLVFLVFVLLLIWIQLELHSILLGIGIIIYFCIIHRYIEGLMDRLWPYIREGKPREPHKLTATLGTIDRTIYAICFALGKHTFVLIGVWFGIKVASRLVGFTKIENQEKFMEEGQRKNVYLIGNVISLTLGLSVGVLIRALIDTQSFAFKLFQIIRDTSHF